MAVVFSNNGKTTLSANVSSSATSISVSDGSVFPSLGSGEIFFCTLDDGTNNEIVKVTAISSNTLTVVRAQESTTARAFSAGDAAELRLTAGILGLFSQTGVAITDEVEAYLDGGNSTPSFASITSGAISASDHIRIVDNKKLLMGSGDMFQIGHITDHSQITTYEGDLYIDQNADDKDIIFRSDNGSGGITDYIRLDGSHGQIKLNKQTIFPDSVEATFGTSGDAGIYHNGTHLYIDEKDAGRIFIRSSNEVRLNKYTGEYMVRAIADGAVELYHDNAKKFETTSGGVSVSGDITVGDSHYIGNQDPYDNLLLLSSSGENIVMAAAGDIYLNTNATSTSSVGNTRIQLTTTGILRYNGTQILDGSRNFTNLGTISSGAITTSAALQVQYSGMNNISLSPTSTGGVINARNSSGTSVVVMDGRGTPFIDVTGNLKTGGTTRIDSSGNLSSIGNITLSGTVDGRDVATDGSKLDGIESGATADQTASEILTAINTVDGSGSGLDADLLDGQHGSYYRSATNINAGTLSTARLADTVPFGANGGNGTENTFTTDGGQGADNVTHSTFFRDNAQTFGTLGVSITHPTNTNYTLQIASTSYSNANTLKARVQNNGTWTTPVTLWSSGNDGPNSGLDADVLDGQHGSYYLNYNNFTNTPTIPTNNNQLTNGAGYITGNQTITLSGDVSGSGTTSISVTVADDSHNHVISNVDGLQTALDAKLTSSSGLNASNLTSGTVPSARLSLSASDIPNLDASKITSGRIADARMSTAYSETRIGQSSHSLVSFTSQSDYSKRAGYSTMMRGTSTNSSVVGTPATASYWFYNVHAKRDTSGGTAATLINYTAPHNFYSGVAQTTSGSFTWAKHWTDANDGSGSGLDADLLDGQHGSHYLDYNNFTNTPTIPSLSGYATESYVNTQVSNLVDSAPGTLDTLNELAAALGDDANFSTTITNSIAGKLSLTGGTMTGNLTISPSGSKIILDAYNTSQEGGGIFFREGFSSSNKYNLSIMARSRSNDGSADGLSINAYEGITFSTGSNSYNERLYLHSSAAFTVPITTTGTVTASGGNSGNWNTAYGWGDHASAGYLTSFDITTQTDSKYLRSDTADSFTGTLTGGTGANILLSSNVGGNGTTAFASMTGQLRFDADYSDTVRGPNKIVTYESSSWIAGFGVHSSTAAYYSGHSHAWYKTNSTTSFTQNMSLSDTGSLSTLVQGTVWGASNDGSGSGLDADTVDGIQASSFLRSDADDTMSEKLTFTQSGSTNYMQNPGGVTFASVSGGDNSLVLRNLNQLRFEDENNWDWNKWGAIKYDSSANTMYIGGPAASQFTSNSSPPSIDVNFVGLNSSGLKKDGNVVWHAGNDGASSGLDADLLDGQHGSYYLNYNNFTNTPTIPTNNNQLTNGAGYTTNTGTVTQVSGTSPISVGDGTTTPVVSFSSSAITTSTSDADGDFFLVHSGTTSSGSLKKLTKANINISGFNNDSGYITSSGNTSGTAGGLSGTPNITVGTISSGAITSSGAVTATNYYINDTNTRLHEGNGNALRIETGTGYVDLGSMNSSWVHFQANKNIYILPSTHVSIDGHLYPYTDSTRTLGGNTVRWSHTYTDNITVTDDVTIGGNVQHTGLTMTSGTDIDQLKTVTVAATLSTSWQDTGIDGSDLSSGTYIVQVFVDDHSVGGNHYDEYYSGVMSWTSANTNSTVTDEIPLHRAGHAPNNGDFFLRTERTSNSDTHDLMLQMRGSTSNTGSSNYVFKFRRMI